MSDNKAADEAKAWEGDFKEEDLVVPYKRDEGAKDDDGQNGAGDDADGAVAGDDAGTDGKADKQDDDYTPEPFVTAEDPGQYKPADYSFEITLADGKTHKVASVDEAERLAEDADNFETAKQLMDFMRKSQKMEKQLERDYEQWESKHKTFSQQVEAEQENRERVDNYMNEFTYLMGKGLLPKIDKQYVDADWSDPEVAKQPGVKEQVAILDYMIKENALRAKAKVKPLSSIVDAYNGWMQDTRKQRAEADTKAAGEARKVAGAKVAGVSPAGQAPYVPKGIAVGNPNALKRGASVWDD